MNVTIRVSEDGGDSGRRIDIAIPAEVAPRVRGALTASQLAQFGGAGSEALEALGSISRELNCPMALEEMLSAIQTLKTGATQERAPVRAFDLAYMDNAVSAAAAEALILQQRFLKLDDAGNPLPLEARSWAAVHDRRSGLIWSAENVGGKRLTHDKAKAVCEKLSLAGASDWQLPTRTQLLTLVDDTRHEPAIEIEFFPGTESAWYWTSTPCAWRPGSAAWCVDFSLGFVGVSGSVRGGECFVRAVRVASPASSQ